MPEHETVIPAAAHEPADVSGRFILGAVALVLGALLVITVGVLIAFPYRQLDRVLRSPLPDYPSPQLQASPRSDMRAFYEREMRQLNGTGWVDRGQSIAHIPIDDAMRQIAREGITGGPTTQGAGR
jgi:hypothetical protein